MQNKVLKILFFLFVINTLLSSQEIKMLVYNVYMLPGWAGRGTYKQKRFEQLKDKFSQYDIVALCELFDDSLREKLIEKMKMDAFHVIEPPGKWYTLCQDGGITLFSRYEIVDHKKIIYKNALCSDAFAEKGAIFAKIKTLTHQFTLVLTHTQAEYENIYRANRRYRRVRCLQFKQLRHALKKFTSSNPNNVIIVGDLNVDAKSPEYTQMKTCLGNFKDAKPKDLYTWNGPENDLAKGNKKQRLDYILYKECNFNITSEIHKFKLNPPIPGKANYLSDHFAVVGDIFWPDKYKDKNPLISFKMVGEKTLGIKTQGTGLVAPDGTMHIWMKIKANGEERIFNCSSFPNQGKSSFSFCLPEHYKVMMANLPKRQARINLVNKSDSGLRCYNRYVLPAQKIEFTDLPSGQYDISLRMGDCIIKKSITLPSQKKINLGNRFFDSTKTTDFALTNPDKNKHVYLVSVPYTKKINPVSQTKFSTLYWPALDRGTYKIYLEEKTKVTVLPIILRQQKQSLDLDASIENASLTFSIKGMLKKNAIVLFHPQEVSLAIKCKMTHNALFELLKKIAKGKIPNSDFALLKGGAEVVFAGYPHERYKFYLYCQDQEVKENVSWSCHKFCTINAINGGHYELTNGN